MLAGRPGEYLAAAWEYEQQESWEREGAERWSCPCGHSFGLYPLYGEYVAFYTLAEDGTFREQVSECPRCQRGLAKTRSGSSCEHRCAGGTYGTCRLLMRVAVCAPHLIAESLVILVE